MCRMQCPLTLTISLRLFNCDVAYFMEYIHMWHKYNRCGDDMSCTNSRTLGPMSRSHRLLTFLPWGRGYPTRSLIASVAILIRVFPWVLAVWCPKIERHQHQWTDRDISLIITDGTVKPIISLYLNSDHILTSSFVQGNLAQTVLVLI